MKRLIIFCLICLCTTALFAQRVGDTLYVNVNSADLKSSTGFFADNTGTVRYGDEVRVTAIEGKWTQVRRAAGNITGWIASSSLTSRRIAAQGNTANASATEIALAGKGFSPEVEAEYKNSGENLNYAAVDEMERATVSSRDLRAFIEEGRLFKGD